MEEKKTIFDYLEEVIILYGVTILLLIGITYLFGDDAKSISHMFQLGNEGLALSTMLQFLLLSIIMTTLRHIIFSYHLIKKGTTMARIFLFLVLVILVIGLFANVFSWFPTNTWRPWVGFFISFFLCTFIGTFLMYIKTNLENKQMKVGLDALKQELELEHASNRKEKK